MSIRNNIIDECIEKALSKIESRGMDKGNLDYGLLEAVRQTMTNLKTRKSKINDTMIHEAISVYETAKREWDGPFQAMSDTLNQTINGE